MLSTLHFSQGLFFRRVDSIALADGFAPDRLMGFVPVRARACVRARARACVCMAVCVCICETIAYRGSLGSIHTFKRPRARACAQVPSIVNLCALREAKRLKDEVESAKAEGRAE